MREIRLYGSEGGGTETNRSSLPLSGLVVGLKCRVVLPSPRPLSLASPHARFRNSDSV